MSESRTYLPSPRQHVEALQPESMHEPSTLTRPSRPSRTPKAATKTQVRRRQSDHDHRHHYQSADSGRIRKNCRTSSGKIEPKASGEQVMGNLACLYDSVERGKLHPLHRSRSRYRWQLEVQKPFGVKSCAKVSMCEKAAVRKASLEKVLGVKAPVCKTAPSKDFVISFLCAKPFGEKTCMCKVALFFGLKNFWRVL